jgi:hypothetical protein
LNDGGPPPAATGIEATEPRPNLVRETSEGGIVARHPVVEIQPARVATATDDERFNTIREHLTPVACLRLNNSRFEFDSSFVGPRAAAELKFLARLRAETPGMPASIFAHADPVGDDEYNKRLSGRRAQAVYALLTRKTNLWEELFSTPAGGDDWGTRSIQTMLSTLGHYAGPIHGRMDEDTRQAVIDFQKSADGAGLATNGTPGRETRAKLFAAYMDRLCVAADGRPFRLDPGQDFLAHGADAGGKGDFQGCSEFNPVLLFSTSEDAEFQADSDKTRRNSENEPNRRVMILLFRPGLKVDPGAWPCPRAKEGTAQCRKRFFSDGEDRRRFKEDRRLYEKTHDTFACRFYDRLARKSPCEGTPGKETLVIRLLNFNRTICANRDADVVVGGRTIRIKTDADGILRATIPEGFQDVAVRYTPMDHDELVEWPLKIHLAPVTDDEGALARLRNLGYPVDEELEYALFMFQRDNELERTSRLDDATRSKLADVHDIG